MCDGSYKAANTLTKKACWKMGRSQNAEKRFTQALKLN